MKRQVSFEETTEAYRFTLAGDESRSFEISKSTLEFNSKAFYETFFKGLHEAPAYELLEPDIELAKTSKHVFATVSNIFQNTCAKIDSAWFPDKTSDAAKPESTPPVNTSGLKEGVE